MVPKQLYPEDLALFKLCTYCIKVLSAKKLKSIFHYCKKARYLKASNTIEIDHNEKWP